MIQRGNAGSGSGSKRNCRTPVLLLALSLALAAPLAVATAGQDQRVVQTSTGPVQGFVNSGVYEFLGIPYAAPPVGSLRWMPPQPPASWTTPRDATTFGNTCPQNYEFGVFAGPPSDTEDCLYLNVFTINPGRGKDPVLVWIHGGGLFDGESNDYDATRLAEGGPAGPTVVVTINYPSAFWVISPILRRTPKGIRSATMVCWISKPRYAGCTTTLPHSAAIPIGSHSEANPRARPAPPRI